MYSKAPRLIYETFCWKNRQDEAPMRMETPTFESLTLTNVRDCRSSTNSPTSGVQI